MKKKIIIIAIVSLMYLPNHYAQSSGEKIFYDKCFACHTVGEGQRVGPDLANITTKRDEDWLIEFIRSSQSLIYSGDSLAIAVYEQYNKILMPDQPINRNETLEVLKYIAANSPDPGDTTRRTPAQIFSAASVTDADIQRGKDLFEGRAKFQNRGAPCIVCHNVQVPGVFNGGLLAKDLTTAFTRLSPAGVDGIVRNPPFPAMITSYRDNPLNDQEIKDILAFLYYTDNKGIVQSASSSGEINLLIITIFGINIVFLIFLLNWRRVKKYSVNSFR